MKLVLVSPVLCSLVQNLRRFSNILRNRVIARLQLLETLPSGCRDYPHKITTDKFTIVSAGRVYLGKA